MKLSIIILNYNVQHFLELCLQSVTEATKNLNAEIIVVDNLSPDESCAMVKQKFPNVVLIENKVNSGFSKGNNIGVAKAKGEFICILNPDTVVAEDCFVKILKFAEKQKNLGAIGCKLINGKGEFLPESKRNIPTVKVAFQKITGNTKNYYNRDLQENQTGETAILVGAFMFLKRETYNAVKGFDEDYFMYGEDIDLSYKLLNNGYSNFYYGETTVIHYKGESTLKDAKYAKRFYGAMQIFYKKHFKRNYCFDGMVWLGINMVKFLPKAKQQKVNTLNSYIIFSNNKYPTLEAKLNNNYTYTTQESQITMDSEIIFDANYISYTNIINHIHALQKHNNHTFKIIPKNANFIIGSNSSKQRGEILFY
ncbi:MAG: glycosyltransferase family 2 protein [Oceanihabitans sp.]